MTDLARVCPFCKWPDDSHHPACELNIGVAANCSHSVHTPFIGEPAPSPAIPAAKGSPLPAHLTLVPRLPSQPEARKAMPIATGVIDYFPDALMDVAALSKIGNDQHNPGLPLHWSRGKSDDHPDCLMRHFIDRGTLDTDGVRHSAKVAWRALAILQLEIEKANYEEKTSINKTSCV
jgi:hypothetical protein